MIQKSVNTVFASQLSRTEADDNASDISRRFPDFSVLGVDGSGKRKCFKSQGNKFKEK